MTLFLYQPQLKKPGEIGGKVYNNFREMLKELKIVSKSFLKNEEVVIIKNIIQDDLKR